MKKTIINSLLIAFAVLVIAALFVYFYVSLNRADKKIMAAQTAIVTDSGKIASIINFFNSNINAQTNK